MTARISLLKNDPKPRSERSCPIHPDCERRHQSQARCSPEQIPPEPDFARNRRQGLYLAACVIDEVENLRVQDPEWIFDEIRVRLAELVRREL